jgi:hypothetical protein
MEAGRRRAGIGLRVFGSRITADFLLVPHFLTPTNFLSALLIFFLCVLYHVALGSRFHRPSKPIYNRIPKEVLRFEISTPDYT